VQWLLKKKNSLRPDMARCHLAAQIAAEIFQLD
jgi:hypothetical protein